MPRPREILRKGPARMPAMPDGACDTPVHADRAAPDNRPEGELRAVSTVRGGHANYTRLMQRHDRMRTRHV